MSADESWQVSLPCTRAEAERLGSDAGAFLDLDNPPVIVTSEPDETQPEAWRLDAYFDRRPTAAMIRRLVAMVPGADGAKPKPTRLAQADWVTISQQGLEPLSAGRFHIRTPDHRARAGAVDFVIPAGLAFGTGQHATTRGCLEAIDALKRRGHRFDRLLDVGTGTGLLAFAAMHCWPRAMATASDIDAIAIDVVRDNAARNAVPLGKRRGQLHLVVADGLAERTLVARAPYDLVIANILAQPLIEMAPMIAAAVDTGGTLLLAGLLDHQAASVARAYRRQGMRLAGRSGGEWPVLRLVSRR